MLYYAHTNDSPDKSCWEPLEDHLREVSELAECFAAAFHSAEWGKLAGLWHDLGKYHPAFQARLEDKTIRQSHAGAGAVLACRCSLLRGLSWADAFPRHNCVLANRWDDRSTLLEGIMGSIEVDSYRCFHLFTYSDFNPNIAKAAK